jgi:hypothetical protein
MNAPQRKMWAMSNNKCYGNQAQIIPRNTQPGHVYLMRCGGLVKVGCSTQPKVRRASVELQAWYQSAVACPVEMLKAWPSVDQYDDERKLQGRLWRHHVAGEWFNIPPRLLAVLLRLPGLDTIRDEWDTVTRYQ